MKLQLRFLSFFLILLLLPFYQSQALARRKKKFKGIIIVNQVLKLDGTLTVNGHPAPEFCGVKEGDTLETGEKSVAIVRIVGLGIFRMGPQARFKLKSFHNRDESKFDLEGGEVLSLFKRPGSHEMFMPHSKLNLHQSTFIARVGNGDGDEVQLIDGKILVKDLLSKNIDAPSSGSPHPAAVSPPSGVSLNPQIPAQNTVSHAEIKEPSKNLVDVVPHPVIAEVKKPETNDLPSEATVSPEGHLKLIRLTPAGVSVIDSQIPDDAVKKNIADLESLYALP